VFVGITLKQAIGMDITLNDIIIRVFDIVPYLTLIALRGFIIKTYSELIYIK